MSKELPGSETLDQKLARLEPIINEEIARVRKIVAGKDRNNLNSEDFNIRGELYRLAFEVAPEARFEDLKYLHSWIEPKQGEVAVDIAAGTGFITIPLSKWTKGQVFGVDPSNVQLENLDKKKGSLPIQTITGSLADKKAMDQFGENVGKVDIITSYGGIHHAIKPDEQKNIFANASKLLKAGGRMTFGDVGAGTDLAKHFEESVKKNCLTGHQEIWLSPEKIQEFIKGTDLELEKTEIIPVKWKFKSEKEMALFMKCLHAYDMSNEDILKDLSSILTYKKNEKGECELNWPMLFVSLKKKEV